MEIKMIYRIGFQWLQSLRVQLSQKPLEKTQTFKIPKKGICSILIIIRKNRAIQTESDSAQ